MFDKDDLNDEDLGFTSYDEIEGICKRHIEEGNDPYNEDEFMDIMNWIQEIRMGEALLSLVLMGDLDIVFKKKDGEEIVGDCETLLFTLSKDGKKKADTLSDIGLFDAPKSMSKMLDFDNGKNKPN